MNLAKTAKKETNSILLKYGRTLISMPDLLEACPDGFTVIQCDRDEATDPETGAKNQFPVFVCSELPDRYFRGGDALTKVFNAWMDEANGDIDALNAELLNIDGVKMGITLTTTKKNKPYYAVTVF